MDDGHEEAFDFEYLDYADSYVTLHNCDHPAATCRAEDDRSCPHCGDNYCAFDNGHSCEHLAEANRRLLKAGQRERERLAAPIENALFAVNVEAAVAAFLGMLAALALFDSTRPQIFAILVVAALAGLLREVRIGSVGSLDDLPSAEDLADGYPLTVECGKFDYGQWEVERLDARTRYGNKLSVRCPLCGASKAQLCTNPETGRGRPEPHQVRGR